MQKYTRFSAVQFDSMETADFCPKMYSRMKFGSDADAKAMGYRLAQTFFRMHVAELLANQHVVIPSPYNHVPNAATIMAKHFTDKLNELLVFSKGEHVESSLIHRKVSYTNDYGFLPKEQRKALIDNDSFYLNHDFIRGKTLILLDDIRITGTHEDKLIEVLKRDNLGNNAYFLYFAEYFGKRAEIEAELNFAAIQHSNDYAKLAAQPNHHIIIRPIKYLLTRNVDQLRHLLEEMSTAAISEIYYGCLAEGYYKLPHYQECFKVIVDEKGIRDDAEVSKTVSNS